MKRSLFVFVSPPTPFISRRRSLCGSPGDKGVSPRTRGLLWTEASGTEAALTCSDARPDGQLRLASAKLHRNQLVAIFNYNTWAALALQPRPWEASRCAWWRVGGAGGWGFWWRCWCSLVPMDEAWLVIWRGVWGRCFVNLLWGCLFFVPFQTGDPR